ncbi:Uncharacterised protein [Klebsiella pneumoniae]|nr:Uncharacterised protein [Klebsiella pneumoniae]
MICTANIQLRPVWCCWIISIRVMVRKTAIGSLVPDSISSVEPTRSLSPLPPSSEKTAAASVEPTMAPISRPSIRSSLNNQAAIIPVSAEVISTPTVASDSAGHSATRKELAWVRIPPSSRITASARLLTI